MRGRRTITIIIICFSVLIIIAGYFGILSLQHRSVILETALSEHVYQKLADNIREYYAEPNVAGKEIKIKELAQFLESKGHNISLREPVAPNPIRDFGVYLLLPEKLESKSPLLIGYTTRVEPGVIFKGRTLRIAFFLRDNEIIPVRLRFYEIREIVGKGKLQQSEPDFYYWPGKSRYIRDQKTW